MKKLWLLLATIGLVFTACEAGFFGDLGGEDSASKIKLSRESIEVGCESGTYSVLVSSPQSWQAESINEWIAVESKTGIAGDKELVFKVESNSADKSREGTIQLTNSAYGLAAELYVIQKPFEPIITITPSSLTFGSDGGSQEVSIVANCEYDVVVDSHWVSAEKIEFGVKVTVAPSASDKERSADVVIRNEIHGISKNIKIQQEELSVGANNVIRYTSSDGNIITPHIGDSPWDDTPFDKSAAFGAEIISNSYEGGEGIIIFNGPVTKIGKSAFSCEESLISITIPESVTRIEDYAFEECTALTSITIPNNVQYIGDAILGGCVNLSALYGKFASSDNRCLVVDGTLVAFAPFGLTTYTIPNDVITIGYGVCTWCENLQEVVIPYGVTRISEAAFWCSSITSVTIPNSVVVIGDYAFEGCLLTSVTIPESVVYIGKRAFNVFGTFESIYCKSKNPPTLAMDSEVMDSEGPFDHPEYCNYKIYVPTESVSVYKNTTGWSEYASYIVGYDFDQNEVSDHQLLYTSTDGKIVTPYSSNVFDANIVSNTYKNGKGVIEFDAPVTLIGKNAFYGCTSLLSITLPNSITKVEEDAFFNCSGLSNVYISDLSAWCNIDFVNYAACPVYYAENLSLNGQVITELTIPSDVTKVKKYTFRRCDSLTKIVIPDHVKDIENSTFRTCRYLESVTIGDGMTSIRNSLFCDCIRLTNITIPENISAIGQTAFDGCSSLTSVYCKPTTPPKGGADMFKDNASGRKIYVPRNSVAAYKSAEYWSEYADSIVGYDF